MCESSWQNKNRKSTPQDLWSTFQINSRNKRETHLSVQPAEAKRLLLHFNISQNFDGYSQRRPHVCQ